MWELVAARTRMLFMIVGRSADKVEAPATATKRVEPLSRGHAPRGPAVVSECVLGGRLSHSMKLRVDPWDPEYGGSIEIEPDLGPPPGLELEIEVPGAWSPLPAPVRAPACCAFIDGVRRIDARLVRRRWG